MTPQDHHAQATYYRQREATWIGAEEKALAGRLAAMHEALAIRQEVRDIRRTIKSVGKWEACQTGLYDELDRTREAFNEAIWTMNWSCYRVRRENMPNRRRAA